MDIFVALWNVNEKYRKMRVPCKFRDTFDVKCLPSGAKRIFFFFFPGTDEHTYGTFYVTLVLNMSPQTWNVRWVAL